VISGRTQIVRFQDPLLQELKLECVSIKYVEFCTFPLTRFESAVGN
jgi:hypothetical protein